MASDGKVVISTELDNSKLPNGLKQVEGSLGGLGGVVKNLGRVIVAAFSVRAVVNFAKECLNLGSDLQEVQNVVDVTFTTMNEQVNAFAKNAAQTAGLSETMAKRYVGTFGAMAKSFKFTEAEAYSMSTALVQLSGDVASFYNLSQDEAYTKLKSVFTGETESLKDLGVVMTQMALDSYALANGFGKTTSQMTEQEKVALRYRFVMDQLSAASGDFVRTSDSWANQTKLLNLQFDQLKATLGQGLINVLTPVVKLLNTLLSQLQGVADAFLSFTNAIFGNAGGSTGAATKAVADSYASAADSAEDLEKSTKETKRALAGFDELNVLKAGKDSTNTESAFSGIATGVSVERVVVDGDVKNNIPPIIQKVINNVTRLFEPLLKIDFSPLAGAFATLGDSVAKFGEIVLDSLEWVWFNLLVPLSQWTIEAAFPAAVDLISAAFDLLCEVLEALQPLGQWLWDSFLKPIAQWTGGVIVDVLHKLADGLRAVSDWISDHQELVRTMAGIVALFVGAWKATELIMWLDAAGGVGGLLKTLTTTLWANTGAKIANKAEDMAIIALYAVDYIKAFGKFVAKMAVNTAAWVKNTAAKVASTTAEWAQIAATTAWNALCAVATTVTTAFGAALNFLTSPIGLVVLAIGALIAIIVLLVQNWETVKQFAANVWNGIVSIWNGVASWFNDNVIQPVAGFFTGMWDGLKNGAIAAWDGIKNVFSAVGTFFTDIFSKAWQGVVNVFSVAGSIFTDIKDGILTAFKTIVNGLIRGINTVVAIPFEGLNAALRAIHDINILGVTPFSWLGTIPVPQIPYLAKGAVLPANKPFLAMVGDQKHGTNVEAPLSTIQEAVALVMEDYAAANMAGHEATVETLREILAAVLGIEVGDATIGQAANRYNQKMAIIKGGL